MKWIRNLVAGLALACSIAGASAQPAAIQTELSFYRNAGAHLPGVSSGTTWVWPGSALSASVHMIYAYLLDPADLLHARILLVWTPGNCSTGVRLVSAEWDLTNIQPVVAFQETYPTPKVSSLDITLALRALIAAHPTTGFYLGMQTRGACGIAPKVYSFIIEMIWN